jgi:hypothetical protein
MRDEVAGLGGNLDAGIEPRGTDARLFGTLVQVLDVQGSASGDCLDCRQPIVRRPGAPGRARTRCVACRPPVVRRPRVPQPCIGCGGDVGPLGRRGRVRIRCRPCRAQMGIDRERRKRQMRRRWCVARNCRFCAREFVPRSHHDTKRRACYDCGLVPGRRWPCNDCGTPCVARGGRCKPCERSPHVLLAGVLPDGSPRAPRRPRGAGGGESRRPDRVRVRGMRTVVRVRASEQRLLAKLPARCGAQEAPAPDSGRADREPRVCRVRRCVPRPARREERVLLAPLLQSCGAAHPTRR